MPTFVDPSVTGPVEQLRELAGIFAAGLIRSRPSAPMGQPAPSPSHSATQKLADSAPNELDVSRKPSVTVHAGYPDLITAPGPGMAPRIKVFDGQTGTLISGPISNFLAYSSSYTGGVNVAAADVDGDEIPDIVTGAVVSAGARVKAFSGVDGSMIANFLVPGAAFANGIKVAAADLTGDGKAEVIVGAGSSGNGRVRTYNPLTGTIIDGPLGRSFRAFGNSYGGTYWPAIARHRPNPSGANIVVHSSRSAITGFDRGSPERLSSFTSPSWGAFGSRGCPIPGSKMEK